MTITQRQAVGYAKEQTQLHTARIVQLLSLQDENSPVHLVEYYRDGMRIPVTYPGAELTVYVYVLPWSRGWSIFTSPDTEAYSFSWRDVTHSYRNLQMPVYNPRDTIGPWHTSAEAIANATTYTVGRVLSRLKRRAAQVKKHKKGQASNAT